MGFPTLSHLERFHWSYVQWFFIPKNAMDGLEFEVMSMELMVLVNKHKFDSPLKKLIFLQLADNADKSGKCWPSYSYIADTSGCGKSTVRKHIKELKELGYLSVINRIGGKGNASNIYVISKEALCDTPVLRGSTPPMSPDSTGVCHEVAQGISPDSTPCATSEHNPMLPGSTRTSHIEPVNESKENKQKKTSKRFKPPTVEEVHAYLVEKELTHLVNARKFVKHYEAANWYRGKTKITRWKSCVATWAENAKEWNGQNSNNVSQDVSGTQYEPAEEPVW